LQDDVKFAELVGTTIANLRQSRRLQRRQSELRYFFAPVVMEAMAGRDADEVLRPREANLSVMFCDLRGFSRASERDSHDLLALLDQVSEALGVMTQQILATDGVIGDFHGDAAMGFWGWPLEQADAAMRAAKTAIAIRRMYADASVASGGFRCGIGIATGRAVAGRIGTVDQVKVTAFGPVVNLASRLEGITKAFGAEIIVDGATAAAIESPCKSIDDDSVQLRKLAVVRPAGFKQAVSIFSLAGDEPVPEDQNARYNSALVQLIDGKWRDAKQTLLSMSDDDGPRNFLLNLIDGQNQTPPPDWDGVIDMPKN
jgi:adenylate cyclase